MAIATTMRKYEGEGKALPTKKTAEDLGQKAVLTEAERGSCHPREAHTCECRATVYLDSSIPPGQVTVFYRVRAIGRQCLVA
jgi:hypothetical protein